MPSSSTASSSIDDVRKNSSGKNNNVASSSSSLVSSISSSTVVLEDLQLLQRRTMMLRLDTTPFVFVYAFFFNLWFPFDGDSSGNNSIVVGSSSSSTSSSSSSSSTPLLVGMMQLATLGAVLFHAFLYLVQQWSVPTRKFIAFTKADSLATATHVFVPHVSNAQKAAIVELRKKKSISSSSTIHSRNGLPIETESMLQIPNTWFSYNSLTYELTPISNTSQQQQQLVVLYKAICAPLPDACSFDLYSSWSGWSSAAEQVAMLQERYGSNRLDVPIPDFATLFKEHVEAPFSVFQLFSVALWCLDDYVWKPILMLVTLLGMDATMVGVRIKTAQNLRGMRPPPGPIYVYRVGRWRVIRSDELVPLDVISLARDQPTEATSGFRTPTSGAGQQQQQQAGGHQSSKAECPADVVLIRGTVVVNEAMLTGESTPQMKESIASSMNDGSSSSSSNGGSGSGATTNTEEYSDEAQMRKKNTLNAFVDHTDRSHARSVVFGGTQVLQHSVSATAAASSSSSAASASSSIPLAPDGGALAIVVRTGARTSQGELLRNIMHASEPTQTGDREGLLFILGLLVFGIAASSYVWTTCSGDPSFDQWKLVLHCIMILTSVVPPELPMELSLAINWSLTALNRLSIFCTEPARMPLAGKVTTCAFDKTGTLTSDEFTVQGIDLSILATGSGSCSSSSSGNSSNGSKIKGGAKKGNGDALTASLIQADAAPPATKLVLAGCHALVTIEHRAPAVVTPQRAPANGAAPPPPPPPPPGPRRELVGDPIEKAALNAIGWVVGSVNGSNSSSSGTSSDITGVSHPQGNEAVSVSVLRRWAFSSALKRMTTIVQLRGGARLRTGETTTGSSSSSSFGSLSDGTYVVCKGAPEVLASLLGPQYPRYAETHQRLSATGSRVLALAYRPLTSSEASSATAPTTSREKMESNLIFAGFLAVTCPLKTDSARTIAELQASAHRVIMITGDAPLTALAVARSLNLGNGYNNSASKEVDARSVATPPSSSSSSSSSSAAAQPQHPGYIIDVTPSGTETQLITADVEGLVAANEQESFGSSASSSTPNIPRNVKAQDLPVSSSSSSPILLCITGRALDVLLKTLSPAQVAEYCRRAHIFARVSPVHKERIIELLDEHCGETTVMVGDGSNDTGALKRAHVGLAVISNPALERKYDSARLQRLHARDTAKAQLAQHTQGLSRLGARELINAQRALMAAEDDVEAVEALLREELPPPPVENGAGDENVDAAIAPVSVGAAGGTSAEPSTFREKLALRMREIEREAQQADGGGSGGGAGGPVVAALGDASMAAPFTSKLPTPASLLHILRQGRCTLVTTHQMYKILAVNCLVLAYELSVLYINNVRSGDTQQTFLGFTIAAFFMFISWAKPMNRLSPAKPQTSVFNPALLLSIASQSITHLLTMVLVTRMIGFDSERPDDLLHSGDIVADSLLLNSSSSNTGAEAMLHGMGATNDVDATEMVDAMTGAVVGEALLTNKLFGGGDNEFAGSSGSSGGTHQGASTVYNADEWGTSSLFKPNVINSAMFLVTTAAQTCTFVVSYHGKPFMEPLRSNIYLTRGAMLVYVVCVLGALGLSGDVNEYLQLVPLPRLEMRMLLAAAILGDFIICWTLERIIRRVCKSPGE